VGQQRGGDVGPLEELILLKQAMREVSENLQKTPGARSSISASDELGAAITCLRALELGKRTKAARVISPFFYRGLWRILTIIGS